jgi:uncharacterized membrane protein YozB (DUF420 family)
MDSFVFIILYSCVFTIVEIIHFFIAIILKQKNGIEMHKRAIIAMAIITGILVLSYTIVNYGGWL